MVLELIDPVDAYLRSERLTEYHELQEEECALLDNTSKETNIAHEGSVSTCSPLLLWRQDKQASFSDWTIVLIADDSEVFKATKRNEKRLKRGVETRGDKKDKLETVFHVHRNILSPVSVYFKVQFEQVFLLEGINLTSTITLPIKAIQAFPVFLDYLYNPLIGRLGFRRENAVSLRHLSIYFGTDGLLDEITKLIFEDMKTESAGKLFLNACIDFNDFKLIEAIKVHKIHQKIASEKAPYIYKTIRYSEYNISELSEPLSVWRDVMRHTDLDFDIFSALQNSTNYPDVFVYGAGIKEANGAYKLVKCDEEFVQYYNGLCILQKNVQTRKWSISIKYYEQNSQQWKVEFWFKTRNADRDWHSIPMYLSNLVPECVITLKSPF